MSVRRWTVGLLAAAALLAVPPARLAAQAGGPVDAETARKTAVEAETQLRSPVTPGHTLDMCPSGEAMALRDTVLTMASAGMSADRIVQTVIANRGEQMRIVPEHRGTGLLAWIAPPVVLLVGGGLLLGKMKRMRARSGFAPAVHAHSISADDRAVLDRALAELEREEAAP
jgi:cytochrome c-type biogenesis protein CcmH